MKPAKLTAARIILGFTQAEFAALLGYTERQINKMERGHVKIRVVTELAVKYLLDNRK